MHVDVLHMIISAAGSTLFPFDVVDRVQLVSLSAEESVSICRLGRPSAVHAGLQHVCIDALTQPTAGDARISSVRDYRHMLETVCTCCMCKCRIVCGCFIVVYVCMRSPCLCHRVHVLSSTHDFAGLHRIWHYVSTPATIQQDYDSTV